jgi:hypothetical protein
MSIPHLTPPLARSGDEPGPFIAGTGGRPLKILIHLLSEQRQFDDSTTTWDKLGVPDPARFLWTLSHRDDITMFWMADSDDTDNDGAVRIKEVNRDRDQLTFTAALKGGGKSLRAVWPFRQWEQLAARSVPSSVSTSSWLQDVLVARVAVELRVDALITFSQALLHCNAPWIKEANPLSAEQALALIGLFLRNRRQYPMAGPNKLNFGEHLFLWSAARAQLPSGWRWGSALVAHSQAVKRDSPTLLFGSLHERVVRVLRYRDRIHAALLIPQDNNTANEATEALDNFMVNLVGAFDAAARAAHLALGLNPKERRLAGWQRKEWRKQVRALAPNLADLFQPGTTHSQILEICRILRNTVHGEALQSIAVQTSGKPLQTLVTLPEDDAQDLADLFEQLGGRDEWGLRSLSPFRLNIDPAVLVERLLPQALQALDDALRLTPVERLDGVIPSQLMTSPPDDLSFGLGTRVRASMLLGLPIPAV